MSGVAGGVAAAAAGAVSATVSGSALESSKSRKLAPCSSAGAAAGLGPGARGGGALTSTMAAASINPPNRQAGRLGHGQQALGHAANQIKSTTNQWIKEIRSQSRWPGIRQLAPARPAASAGQLSMARGLRGPTQKTLSGRPQRTRAVEKGLTIQVVRAASPTLAEASAARQIWPGAGRFLPGGAS